VTTRYYHTHPRQFANECIYVRTVTEAERAEAERRDYERITRADLVRHIAWMNAENTAWGSGRAVGKYHLVNAWTPEEAFQDNPLGDSLPPRQPEDES
jgi:hypothetical protein